MKSPTYIYLFLTLCSFSAYAQETSSQIQFETTTILPPQAEYIQFTNIKDVCGNIIGINKPTWRLFKYNYNLHIMEERYNILKFTSGMASLLFSR